VRVRHRIPSIFNLSMVDVLCCALGCVILLWLVNLRNAKEHEDQADDQRRQAADLLASARGERDEAYVLLTGMAGQLDALDRERADLRRKLARQQAAATELEGKVRSAASAVSSLENDLRTSRANAQAQAARAAELEGKLKVAGARAQTLEGDLRAAQARAADEGRKLGADLKAARDRLAAEEAMAKALEKEVASKTQELGEAGKKLEAVRASRGALERDLGERDRELAQARNFREKWQAREERVLALEKQLTDAGRAMVGLQEDRRSLQAEVGRVRAAAENRFAGIQLTGRRVVFLVDTSGSMDLVDEQTPAPTKWADVRATVARLMRSLPELEKFQVVTFAEKTSYLLGGDGGWLDYDPRASPDRVVQALAGVKPQGGTNMYAALEAAFALRAQGLDTIYLLSDGLPNQGEGLPAAPARPLTEVERNDLLAKQIRRTLRDNWNLARPGLPRVRINSVGFFFESPDVGAFLWALSRENDGSFVGMSKP
jgi:hypothetical protein